MENPFSSFGLTAFLLILGTICLNVGLAWTGLSHVFANAFLNRFLILWIKFFSLLGIVGVTGECLMVQQSSQKLSLGYQWLLKLGLMTQRLFIRPCDASQLEVTLVAFHFMAQLEQQLNTAVLAGEQVIGQLSDLRGTTTST
jgi:uncharacterized protein YqhQ